MKLFGSLKELVALVFRKNSQEITLRPNQSTTYTAARDIQLPPGDSAHVLMSASSSQTITGKTIDGDDNTVQDLPVTAIKTVLGDADKVLLRDASGVPTSAKIVNANVDAAAAITYSKLSIADGDLTIAKTSGLQTALDGKVDENAPITGATKTKITYDAKGLVTAGADLSASDLPTGIDAAKIADGSVDNTEFQRLGTAGTAGAGNLVTTDGTQTITGKTVSGSSNTLTVLAGTQLSGQVPIANGGTGQSTQTAAFDALSPTTTKGDISVHDGTDNIRLAVGTNGYVLTADSAVAAGVKWAAATSTVDPTALSDADATKLGLKVYSHGTSYNGGNAPTVTLILGGGTLNSVHQAEFIPYQVQSGGWRMRFNVDVTLSSATRTTTGLAINGILFPNSSGDGQAIAASSTSAANAISYGQAFRNSNEIYCSHSSATSAKYCFSGDVKLNSKPTWAY